MDELDLGIVTIESTLGFFASGSLGGSGGQASGFRGTYAFEGGIDAGIKVKANNLLPGGMKPYGAIEGEGKVEIGGEWYPVLTCAGSLELQLRGSIGVTVPVRAILLLDPSGAGASFNSWVDKWPKRFRNKFDGFAYLDASFGAHIQTTTPLRLSEGRLYLDSQNGLYGLGTDVKIKGHVGTDSLYVEGLLAGGGTCWFRSTAEGDSFDHAEYAIEGKATIGYFQWEKSFGVEFTKTVPDLGARMARMTRTRSAEEPGMSLIPRDYARKNYGNFILRSQDVKARRIAADSRSLSAAGPLGAVTADVFVQNVFPNTTAALAGSSTNDVTMLFSFDNTNLPAIQAMDIYFTRYNGTSWSAPAPVETNTQSELHPQMAIDASNRPVAVWMRIRDPDFNDTSNDVHYLSQLDVVGSSFDAGGGGWAPAQSLSTAPCLNFAPILSRAPSGALAAWWQSNPSNQLVGGVASSNNAPSDWWWARWNNATRQFLPAERMLTNVTAGMSPSLAYGGTNAWLFWVWDRDDDFSTSNDTSLCYRRWDGTAWGTNVVLTPPEQTVTRVETAMLSNGVPMAVWWQNGDLVYASGPSFATVKTARAGSGDLVWQEMHLLRSPATENVLLVFPKSTTNGVNLAYRVYDAAADVWGDDFAFESATAIDFGLAPTFVGPQMWAAYTRGVLAYSNGVANVGGEAMVVSHIPYRARTALMLARFELDADVAAVDVTVPASFPPAIRVVVANEGDTAVTNLIVSIREGSSSGPEIAAWTNQAVLRPHATDTNDIPWSVSPQAAVRTLTAVLDPDNRIAEFREANNAVTRTVLETDLRIAQVSAEPAAGGTYDWIVRTENLIARPISNVVVEVHRDTSNGVLVASVPLAGLPAYQSADLRLTFDASGWGDTNVLVTVVRAPPATGETVETRRVLASVFSPAGMQVPGAATDLQFRRPGLSNEVSFAWTPPVDLHDGVRVVRSVGTNTAEDIGFAEVPSRLYLDRLSAGATQVAYRVAAYNARGVGPLSGSLATNFAWYIDANGDGLPDGWQVEHFGSVSNATAAWGADSDRDGFANWQEYLFGTNPGLSNESPRIWTDSPPGAAEGIRLQWLGAALQPYRVQFTTNLADSTGWADISGTVLGVEGTNTVQDPPAAGGAAHRFYRVVTP